MTPAASDRPPPTTATSAILCDASPAFVAGRAVKCQPITAIATGARCRSQSTT
jgi:hypothetical protein